MEEILNFIAEWGLPHFLIGLIIINIVGILKLCKVFSKITNTGVKKTIYYGLDIVLSFGVVACYFAIFGIGFTTFIKYSVEQLTLTTAIYAIYENLHIRDVWKIVLNWVGNWFKYNPDNAVTKLAKKVGFDEAIVKLQEEKQKDAEQKAKEAEEKARKEAEAKAKEEAKRLAKEQEKQKVEQEKAN